MAGFGVDRGSGASSGSTAGAIAAAIIDVKGDLIAGTAADTASRLAAGPDGQRLVADSTQLTGLKYVADTTDYAVTAKGDLKAGTANQTVARVAVGTNGQRLAADSAQAAGVKWVDDTQNTVATAKGDLLVGAAAQTIAKLGVGTDGQALVANSAATLGANWADVPTNTSPHRQTQLVGPLDSGGYNATLSAGAALNFNVDASPTNAVYTFAGGFNSAGASDLVTVLTADAANQGSLNANNTHYLSATRTSASAVTWGQYLVPPQYGYAFDRSAGTHLTFEAANASVAMIDDFGNTWTAAGTAQITTAQFKFGTSCLLLSGAGAYVTSSSFKTLGEGSWEISCWFRLNALPGAGTDAYLFSALNGSNFGAKLGINNTVGTSKLTLTLSSNGSSADIASATLGANTTWALNQWNRVRLVFDALAGTYKVYLSLNAAAESADISVASSARICSITTFIIGADVGGASAYNGWIDSFRFLRCATNTSAETPSIVAPAIIDYPYHFFSIPEMKMYEVTSASASAGVNPGMTQRTRMFVGEADTGAGTVSAIRNYALRGQYVSAWGALQGLSANTSYNHNLGTIEVRARAEVQMRTSATGASVGATAVPTTVSQSGTTEFCFDPVQVQTRNVASVCTGSINNFLFPLNNASGTDVFSPAASAAVQRLVVERAF